MLLGASVALFLVVSVALAFMGPRVSQAVQSVSKGSDALQGRWTAETALEWAARQLASDANYAMVNSSKPDASTPGPTTNGRTPTVGMSLISGPNAVLWDQGAANLTLKAGLSIPLSYRTMEDFSFKKQPPAVTVAGQALEVSEPASYHLVPSGDLTPQYMVEGVGATPGAGSISGNVFTATSPGTVRISVKQFVTADASRTVEPSLYSNSLTLTIGSELSAANALTLLPGDSATLNQLSTERIHTFRALYGGTTDLGQKYSWDVVTNGQWTFTPGTGDATLKVDDQGAHLTPIRSGTGTLRVDYVDGGRTHSVTAMVTFKDPSRAIKIAVTDGSTEGAAHSVIVATPGTYEVLETEH